MSPPGKAETQTKPAHDAESAHSPQTASHTRQKMISPQLHNPARHANLYLHNSFICTRNTFLHAFSQQRILIFRVPALQNNFNEVQSTATRSFILVKKHDITPIFNLL
jgi:hypothetical protein